MRETQNQRHHHRSGAHWAVYDALTNLFMVAFVLALGATNMEVGLIGALPWIAMFLSQIPAVHLLEHFTRLQVYKYATIIGRLMWVMIILVALNGFEEAILICAALYFLSKFAETLTDPSWATIMGDIVPKKDRGAFVGKRLWLTTITGTGVYIAGGFVLGMFDRNDITGFVLLFVIGIIFGVCTTLEFLKIKEPTYNKGNKLGVVEFIRMSRNFRLFCVFAGVFHFAYFIAGPFYTVYLLRNLNLSYEFFVLSVGIATISKAASQQFIGMLSDQIGEKKVGVWSVLLLSLVPLIYAHTTVMTLWYIIPAQIISGIALAGMGVVIYAMELNLSPEKHRAVSIAQYDMIIALPLAIAPIAGGWMADNATIADISGVPLVFMTSFVLILASLILMLPIPEPRGKRKEPLYHSLQFLRQRMHNKQGGNRGL